MIIRATLAATLIALAAPVLAQPAPPPEAAAPEAAAPEASAPEASAIEQAFHFAFPLYAMARTRSLMPAINTLGYRTTLSDHRARDVTTPNNDTLYASAFLDLAAGPVILDLPALPGRYHSVAIMGMNTDNLAILGTRTGSQGGRFALVQRDYQGPFPEGTTPLRLDCRDCWLLARVLVTGPDDLEDAATALKGITLEAPEAEPTPFAAKTPARPDGATFLAAIREVVERAGPASRLAQQAATFEALTDDPAAWNRALPALSAALQAAPMGETVQGWSYPPFAIGNFEDDHAGRARVALSGLGALPRVEAIYLFATTDSEGQPLSGRKAYSLRIPYRMPIGGFWSLTMYSRDPDGRLFLVENPLNRFSVGDRSRHLRADRDGSTEIFIQPSRPSGERIVNWLPSPAGPFTMVFRAYLPRAEMLDGSFRLPAITESELIP